MSKTPEPVMLELAALPREQMGPFLLLGLSKEADRTQIELHWSERVKWARRQQTRVPLEDINWARDVLSDADRRLRADVTSFNIDTMEGQLTQLARRHGAGAAGRLMWQPLDCEKALAEYVPPAEVPDSQAVRAEAAAPELPCELPPTTRLLEQLVLGPLDPWSVDLLPQDHQP